MLWRYLEQHRRPLEFYTDKAQLFEIAPQQWHNGAAEPLPLTQIIGALVELGISRSSAHSPQAQRTLGALLCYGTRSISQRSPDGSCPHPRAGQACLSRVETCIIINDYTIQFRGQRFQIARSSVRVGLSSAKVWVAARLDGSLAVHDRGKYLPFEGAVPRAARQRRSPRASQFARTTIGAGVALDAPLSTTQAPDVWKAFSIRSHGYKSLLSCDGFLSLYLFVAWLILDSAAPTLSFAGGHESGVEHGLLGLLRLGLFLCRFYLLINAAQQKQVRLPILGDLASRSAT